ncbi:13467_t:CDS:2 [Entrophospora sp. SA101]|nr:10700_t:CDS:2 [Entrophospora sp. SA101]CAJ0908614.1 13467_t:CDS:2 [Entrophospora sp. SA101]
MKEQQKKIATFRVELKNDPAYKLFSEEQSVNLMNIVGMIVRGESDFLVIKKEEEKKEKEESQKYLGFIPKKYGKKLVELNSKTEEQQEEIDTKLNNPNNPKVIEEIENIIAGIKKEIRSRIELIKEGKISESPTISELEKVLEYTTYDQFNNFYTKYKNELDAIVYVKQGLIGFNVYINYRTYGFKREKENERLKKQEERDAKDQLDRDIAEMQKEALEGKILRAEDVEHLGIIEHGQIACTKCNACDNCRDGEECLEMKPCLIFSDEVNEYLRNVLQAMTNFINKEDLEPDGYSDSYSPFLKRHNAVLYGAPGTGKTVMINEIIHHLQEKFGDPHNEISDKKKEIKKLEQQLDQLKAKAKIVGNKNPKEVTPEDKLLDKQIDELRKQIDKKNQELQKLQDTYKVPPVFKIDGAKLETAGEAMGQPQIEDKLIKIIEMCKKEAFNGKTYSDEPYIVFVEEADQGKNVLTAGKNNLLEGYKNFLSTSEDKLGLKAKAQDPNSIILIATNNFDQIDPAVMRRGRLGEKLNFN